MNCTLVGHGHLSGHSHWERSIPHYTQWPATDPTRAQAVSPHTDRWPLTICTEEHSTERCVPLICDTALPAVGRQRRSSPDVKQLPAWSGLIPQTRSKLSIIGTKKANLEGDCNPRCTRRKKIVGQSNYNSQFSVHRLKAAYSRLLAKHSRVAPWRVWTPLGGIG